MDSKVLALITGPQTNMEAATELADAKLDFGIGNAVLAHPGVPPSQALNLAQAIRGDFELAAVDGQIAVRSKSGVPVAQAVAVALARPELASIRGNAAPPSWSDVALTQAAAQHQAPSPGANPYDPTRLFGLGRRVSFIGHETRADQPLWQA